MENLFHRLFRAVIWSGLIMGLYSARSLSDERNRRLRSPLESYIGYVPVFFLLVPVMALLLPKRKQIVFLHAALQLLPGLVMITLLLLAASPWLRKRYSAHSCADLWILPGILTHVFLFTWRYAPDPWLTLRVPRRFFWLFLGLWATGFCTVMGWKLLEHFRFRRTILRGAVPVSCQERALFRQLWSELDPKDRRLGRRVKLVNAPAIASPLTVGLFSRTVCMALPLREYSEEEQRLIFRHESIHLLRRDNVTKFSNVFLCAMNWFIPSFWMVTRRASEDLELCCDEFVTSDMKKAGRKQYAQLLLNSTVTEKGFTTCLSASARGLRYRLRRIMRPYGRTAVPMIGLLTALFLFFFGTVGVELGVGTVQTAFLNREQGWHVSALDPGWDKETAADPAVMEVVEDYLRELELAMPLWVEAAQEPVSGDVRVTLTDEVGRTAVLCFDEDGVYYLLPEDSAPKFQYRIHGDYDLDTLRGIATGAS